MNDIEQPAGTTYFQYVSNRSEPFGPQVFFWLSNQGGATPWIQFITNYDDAGAIATWLSTAQIGGAPGQLTPTVSSGNLSFSSTRQTITIYGDDGNGTSLTGTFNVEAFAGMIWAAIFSINAMVQNDSDFAQGAANPPQARKVLGQ